jgi:hypothetical protein
VAAWNDGAWNDGAWNDGAWNDGAWNDGAWNDGAWNDGAWNDGDRNDGDRNDGAWNDGDRNDGDRNDGAWTDARPLPMRSDVLRVVDTSRGRRVYWRRGADSFGRGVPPVQSRSIRLADRGCGRGIRVGRLNVDARLRIVDAWGRVSWRRVTRAGAPNTGWAGTRKSSSR